MRPAVRLGLELVNGFNQAAAERIVAARAQAPFADVADLTLRAQLSRGEIARLAAADALASLAGHRRDALWASLGLEPDAPRVTPLIARARARAMEEVAGMSVADSAARSPAHHAAHNNAVLSATHSATNHERVDLLAPTEGENIVADYEYTALTLRRHPLALLRSRFEQMRLATALQVANARHRQMVRTTGIVVCRQRPATASGVTFVTLEDETGVLNVVVWRATADKYRRELLGATLLTVYGHVERVSTAGTPLIHLIAERLVDHSALLGGLTVRSHDFH